MEADAAQKDDARAAFARDGYALLPALIEPPLTAFLWSYIHTLLASRRMKLGDPLTPTTPSVYGDPAFDGLLEYLRPKIEAATALRLTPTYSHVRLYNAVTAFAGTATAPPARSASASTSARRPARRGR